MTNVILGTMTFGESVDYNKGLEIVKSFVNKGYTNIDTAYVYNEGQSEKIIGKILKKFDSDMFQVSTKVNPRITGKLDRKSITDQLEISLKRLDLESIDILYLHFPDNSTPLEETLKTCDDLYRQGKFKRLGLSNYPAWQVVEISYLCQINGWIKPSVYQGMYNLFSKKCEYELLPALQKLEINFYAYNPLAGGLLSGKYASFKQDPSQGRFTNRPNYQNRYWKESMFRALNLLVKEGSKQKIEIAELAFRWLANHSKLANSKDNSIILGVSKLEHLVSNIRNINNSRLPENLQQTCSDIWDIVKHDSPEYFRGALIK